MKEIKLYNLLNSFSRKELNELEDFVSSRIFNKNKSLIKLHEYISKNYKKFINDTYSKHEIFNYIFKNEKFSETKYWKLISSFALIIDKYLMFKEYSVDHYYQKNHLLEAYRRRNIKKQYSYLSKEIKKNYSNEFNKGLNFFLNQTHFHFQNISYLGSGESIIMRNDIESMFENLRMFFIMTNITSISIISNFKKDFLKSSSSKLWLLDEILEYLRKNRTYMKKNYITVYIFYLIIVSKINFDDEKHYFEARKLIMINIKKFSKNLLKHMLLNILNYSVIKMVKGDDKFLKEIFLINKVMDENSLTFFGENIEGDYFYSVIEHTTMLQQVLWAKEFLEKYKSCLSEESRESTVNLSAARIHFENNEYDMSLQQLLKVDNINPYFYLSHKILLLQNYFETGENESITPLLETLSKYLKRRIDISDELKDNYIKFLFYFRKLKTVSTTKVYLASNLLKELQKEKFFLQKKWILEKAGQQKQLKK